MVEHTMARSRADPACALEAPRERHGAPAFAALDLGTNNCRLLVGCPCAEGFRVIDSYSRLVRLGEGLQLSGQLSAGAMDRAMVALQACAERLGRRPLRAVRAIATEACRRAGNGPLFLDRVRRETGLAIAVISPREEARLALASCAPLLARLARAGARRVLLLDIGGGSTELAWVRLGPPRGAHGSSIGPQLIGTVSLPTGVIDVAEAWGGGSAGAGEFEATVGTLIDQLQPFDAVHCIAHEIRQGGVALLGTSGTLTTLAGIALGLTRYRRTLVDGVVLDGAAAQAALAHVRGLGREGLAAHPCIGPDRAELAVPGCAIFAAIHRLWPAGQIMVADRGLREGMLLQMMREDARQGRTHSGRAAPRAERWTTAQP